MVRAIMLLTFLSMFSIIAQEEKSLMQVYRDAARILCEHNLSNRAVYYTEETYHHEPDNFYTAFNHANTLNMANFTKESLSIYYRLLDCIPDNQSFLYNAAYTLNRLYEIDKALFLYDVILKLYPDYKEALFSQGLSYLTRGDFKQGWAGYEYRFSHGEFGLAHRDYSQPLWHGEPVKGDIIYLYGEQAHGDILQFIRFGKIAKDRGATVYASVHESLVPLLSLCPYLDCVIAMHQYPSHFTYHAPLMSIPHLLSLENHELNVTLPYLFAQPDLVNYWHEKTASDTNLKVGLCFRGNTNYATACLRAAVQSKSIPLHLFAPLAAIPGVTLYSIHRQSGWDALPDEYKFPLVSYEKEDFDQSHGRFMDTTALIANMDVIVSIDTSLCHLSAGLGIHTLLLLPNPADFRWGSDPHETLWYPHIMTLFRQQDPDDWDEPLARVARDLEKRARAKNPHIYDSSLPVPEKKSYTPPSNPPLITNVHTKRKPAPYADELLKKINALENEISLHLHKDR